MSNSDYPKCNLTVNGEEYYEPGLGTLGTALSIPFLLSLVICACVLSLIFGGVGYNTYNTTKKYSFGVILLIILTLCCFSSFIGNLISLYKAKNKVEKPENKDSSSNNLSWRK